MLKVIRAKPNPLGKDRSTRLTTQTQLGAEWIDVQNTGGSNFSLDNIQVYHVAYSGLKAEWALWVNLGIPINHYLPPLSILRVHSGSGPVSVLLPVDINGANYHYFTGSNYVWNNDMIDRPMLYDAGRRLIIDQTYYDVPVLDGKILLRYLDKLV